MSNQITEAIQGEYMGQVYHIPPYSLNTNPRASFEVPEKFNGRISVIKIVKALDDKNKPHYYILNTAINKAHWGCGMLGRWCDKNDISLGGRLSDEQYILCSVPLDNYNRRHQKILNYYKKEFIRQIREDNPQEDCCNILFLRDDNENFDVKTQDFREFIRQRLNTIRCDCKDKEEYLDNWRVDTYVNKDYFKIASNAWWVFRKYYYGVKDDSRYRLIGELDKNNITMNPYWDKDTILCCVLLWDIFRTSDRSKPYWINDRDKYYEIINNAFNEPFKDFYKDINYGKETINI